MVRQGHVAEFHELLLLPVVNRFYGSASVNDRINLHFLARKTGAAALEPDLWITQPKIWTTASTFEAGATGLHFAQQPIGAQSCPNSLIGSQTDVMCRRYLIIDYRANAMLG